MTPRVIAVFLATGVRLSELTGICYVPDDRSRTDVDLQGRELRIRGKGGNARIAPGSRSAGEPQNPRAAPAFCRTLLLACFTRRNA